MTETAIHRREFALRSVIVAACAVVLLILGGLSYTAYINRTTLNEVRSCTIPGGTCYERGQDQTGEAVDSINRVVVYAAICADRPGVQGQNEIEACVLDLLRERSE